MNAFVRVDLISKAYFKSKDKSSDFALDNLQFAVRLKLPASLYLATYFLINSFTMIFLIAILHLILTRPTGNIRKIGKVSKYLKQLLLNTYLLPK